MNTKEKLHKLVDQINDEKLLQGYLKLLEIHAKEMQGKLWNSLSESEKEEHLLSYEESFDVEVKKTFKRWL